MTEHEAIARKKSLIEYFFS